MNYSTFNETTEHFLDNLNIFLNSKPNRLNEEQESIISGTKREIDSVFRNDAIPVEIRIEQTKNLINEKLMPIEVLYALTLIYLVKLSKL